MIFKIENLNKFSQWKSFKNKLQSLYISCQLTPRITELTLMDNRKVATLNQVLVIKLPNKALARFAFKRSAKNMAVRGPMLGIIPVKTPIPNPWAIFCGVSLILKSFI